MFASAGILIPEGAISWEFQAEDKKDKKEHHRGFANGKRKISTSIHRRVGSERTGEGERNGERGVGVHAEPKSVRTEKKVS